VVEFGDGGDFTQIGHFRIPSDRRDVSLIRIYRTARRQSIDKMEPSERRVSIRSSIDPQITTSHRIIAYKIDSLRSRAVIVV